MANEASGRNAKSQAKPAKPQIPARLLVAVRTVLDDATDADRRNSVAVSATAYNALRNVLHELTGQWYGMEVEELDDEEDEDEEEDEDDNEE
jgi:hypothetical protein